MGNNKTENNNGKVFICGVEKEVIEKFLVLIKEKYPLVDKANYFLELNTRLSGINIAITNQRDIISHLCTILTHPDFSRDEKLAQFNTAEEHLRRACMEPYEKAVSLILKDVFKILKEYKELVIPLKNSDTTLTSAPDIKNIELILKEINELREEGRDAKKRNIWDKEWEAGQKSFIKAFEKSKKLINTLEKYLGRAKQTKFHMTQRDSNKKQIFLTVWGIVATIISIILGIILFF